jgi:hypothetical protein
LLQRHIYQAGIKAGDPDQLRITIEQKWLFSAAPILLNGRIH